MVETQVERDEAALAALREHENACAKRYEGYGERFAKLETAVAGNSKLLWAVLGVTIAVAAKEFLEPLFSG